jgi:hypothetical protein
MGKNSIKEKTKYGRPAVLLITRNNKSSNDNTPRRNKGMSGPMEVEVQ